MIPNYPLVWGLLRRAPIKEKVVWPCETTVQQQSNLKCCTVCIVHCLVKELFSQVARHYDTMNDAMSLGMHHCWKDYLIKKLNPTSDTKLLDVGGGTGSADICMC